MSYIPRYLLAILVLFGCVNSNALDLNFAQWSGRIDADALIELNEMANRFFPISDSDSVSQRDLKQPNTFNRVELKNYRILEENVISFVRSKGFYLKTPPLQQTDTNSFARALVSDQKNAEQLLANFPVMNPYLERIFLERIEAVSEKFFEGATSNRTYKIVDSAIAFIPIFGAFYAAKRLQDPSSGPVAKSQENQRQQYKIIQDCAYIESLESEQLRSGYLSAETCKSFFPNEQRIQTYREMMDYAFVASLLMKIKRLKDGCLQIPFALDNQLSKKVYERVTEQFIKHSIAYGWLFSVMYYTGSENLFCASGVQIETNANNF